MSVFEEYRKIYEKEIEDLFKKEILAYDEFQDTHIFQPLSHNCNTLCSGGCNHQCYKSLGQLMRKNIVFYCYGEDEIVKKAKTGALKDLAKATRFAYKNRLPKRKPIQDGLPSEVLFDLMIQTMFPDAYKLAVRTIFRQNDNNEIKGYDLTYFTMDKGKITLWLGQAKLGSESYCKTGINDDLANKFDSQYLSKQIYFMADKQCGLTEEGIKLTNVINDLNLVNTDENDVCRAQAFIQYIKDNDISINIPCLLAYGKNSVYMNVADLESIIEKEINSANKYFQNHKYDFEGYQPQLMFFVFPIEDLEKLRGDEGFYAGLC